MDDDALHWMNTVEKELEKTGKLEDTEVRLETVRCAVFHFTCNLLGVSLSFSFKSKISFVLIRTF